MKTILFICTGNVCRSPMAEGLFRHLNKRREEYRVISAGVGALEGQEPSPHAVQALREVGVDISNQRSRTLTAELVNKADFIFGMTHGHIGAVTVMYPQAAEKTFLLREFDEKLETFEKDIADPIGGTYEVYLECRDQIQQGITTMLRFIEQSDGATPISRTSEESIKLCIGSDHAGLDLKEMIKAHLLRQGLSVLDLGTNSPDSTDYPDFARPVAKSVARQESDLGILVCSTGVGMSITANKVPGIRAALVFTEQMASLAKKHNNANVLCLGQTVTPPEEAIRIIDRFLND